MNKFIKIMIVTVTLAALVGGATQLCLASKLEDVGTGIYGDNSAPAANSLPFYVGLYIRMFLYISGTIMIIIVVYAGTLWMTAGGDDGQLKKAKSWLTNGIIGLIITLAAFAITDYIFGKMIEAAKDINTTK